MSVCLPACFPSVSEGGSAPCRRPDGPRSSSAPATRQRPRRASILRPPATRHTLSSAPRNSAVPAAPLPLRHLSSVDATGRAAGLERWGPSASPHPGVAAAAPSGPRRARPCGDRRSDGAQKFGEERRGRGRERARPPPGHAPFPPRNAPARARERNARARAPGTQGGSALRGGATVGGALRLRRCGQKSMSKARHAD